MLGYITLLLVCQLIGESIARLAAMPVPGPVIGMILLFAGLVVRGRVPARLETVSSGLLRNLTLLFVPAAVGVIVHLDALARQLLPIAAAVIVGTLVTIAVTGSIMQALNRHRATTGDEQ